MKEISLEPLITEKCNLNCPYCFRSKEYPKQELDIKDYENMFNEIISKSKIKSVQFSGGEPFVKNELLENLISFTLKKTKAKIKISTNGYFYSHIGKLIHKLNSNEKDRLEFIVSMDGNLDVFKYLHGKVGETYYRNILKTISLIKKSDIDLFINVVILKPTLPKLRSFLKYLIEELSIKDIDLLRYIPMGNGRRYVDVFSIDNNDINSVYKNVIKLQEKYKVKIDTREFLLDYCLAHNENRFIIDPVGNVQVCIAPFLKKYISVPFYNLKNKILQPWDKVMDEAKKKFEEISKKYNSPTKCTAYNIILKKQFKKNERD